MLLPKDWYMDNIYPELRATWPAFNGRGWDRFEMIGEWWTKVMHSVSISRWVNPLERHHGRHGLLRWSWHQQLLSLDTGIEKCVLIPMAWRLDVCSQQRVVFSLKICRWHKAQPVNRHLAPGVTFIKLEGQDIHFNEKYDKCRITSKYYKVNKDLHVNIVGKHACMYCIPWYLHILSDRIQTPWDSYIHGIHCPILRQKTHALNKQNPTQLPRRLSYQAEEWQCHGTKDVAMALATGGLCILYWVWSDTDRQFSKTVTLFPSWWVHKIWLRQPYVQLNPGRMWLKPSTQPVTNWTGQRGQCLIAHFSYEFCVILVPCTKGNK